MARIHKGFVAGLLLAGTALHAGCAGDTGIKSLTAVTLPDAPPGITNEDAMARPASVAWTAARAQRCGFYFDPAKLRTNYLTYEGRQGVAGEQYAKIERVYDDTYKLIYARVSSDADYCNDRRGLEIKDELKRHLAGDYAPNLPKPKMVANCGTFGCAKPDSKFDGKKFFEEQDKRR